MTETAYDKNHTDIMACIGYICVQWALLEQILLQTIFVMQDLESTEGEICFGGLDIQPRVNLAINLAKHQKAPKKIINELKEIRKAIQDGLSQNRNRAIHGVHADADRPDAVRLHMARIAEPNKTKIMTIRELHQVGLDIKTQAEAALLVFGSTLDWKRR